MPAHTRMSSGDRSRVQRAARSSAGHFPTGSGAPYPRTATARGHGARHRARASRVPVDEPLSNLDASCECRCASSPELHRELRTTSIFVTHDKVER